MEGHAGTKWLTTSAGIAPGETFTLVLAIFDMSDSVLDSYAFIDNFEWGCEGDVPPSTTLWSGQPKNPLLTMDRQRENSEQ